MNIKDFLMDNYIYIIIVIILIIITIIGFLADKQKNNKAKNANGGEPLSNANPSLDNTPRPITYQPVNNNQMGNTMATPNLMPNNGPIANGMPINNQLNNNMGMPQPNIPQPVEPMNVSASVNPEPMYQPLSEQKPTIQPTNPINNINSFNNGPLNNPISNNVDGINQINNIQPTNVITEPITTNQPVQGPTMVSNPVPNPINIQPQPVDSGMNLNNGINANPVSPNPIPIPNPQENPMPGPINPPQPTIPQPVGFVFGPQQGQNNNNQQM